MSGHDNNSDGLNGLIPMAIFIGVWVLLGIIDEENPGQGKDLLLIILAIAGVLILVKIIEFFEEQSREETIAYFSVIGKYFLWFVVAVITFGLFDCGGGEFDLDGLRN